MKRILLSASLALALSGSVVFAQSTTTPTPTGKHFRHHPPDPQQEAAWLSTKLNLSSDQTAKLEPILADRDQKMSALRSNTSLSPDEKKQQMRALHQDLKQQLSTVLTPEQLEQMKSLRHGHRGPHQPPPSGL
jgi:Spy/CpxP family protein refolding chaperone